jgi:peptidoglycan/LPS O-acetylase OafA/YrhL
MPVRNCAAPSFAEARFMPCAVRPAIFRPARLSCTTEPGPSAAADRRTGLDLDPARRGGATADPRKRPVASTIRRGWPPETPLLVNMTNGLPIQGSRPLKGRTIDPATGGFRLDKVPDLGDVRRHALHRANGCRSRAVMPTTGAADLSGRGDTASDGLAEGRAGGILVLDVLRWLSALEVMVNHVRDLFFADFHTLQNPGLATRLLYTVTGFGYEAVIVFFVLSGFLVGGKTVLDMTAGRFTASRYGIDRFSRIYVVLVPALLLTYLCDHLGPALFPDAPIYLGGAWSPALAYDYRARIGVVQFLCNLANLQFTACTPYGTNGPLWSLAYEWVYYLSFPVLLASLRHAAFRASYLLRVLLAAAGVAALYYCSKDLIELYPIWLMGVAARLVARRRPFGWGVTVAAFMVLPISLLATRLGLAPRLPSLYLLGLSLGLLISAAPLLRLEAASRINQHLAAFSYSLYAFHFPLVVFLLAFLQQVGLFDQRVPPTAPGWALITLAACGVYGAAFLLSRLTERHTFALRQHLRRLIGAGVPSGARPRG